jgi:hypothetical protein
MARPTRPRHWPGVGYSLDEFTVAVKMYIFGDRQVAQHQACCSCPGPKKFVLDVTGVFLSKPSMVCEGIIGETNEAGPGRGSDTPEAPLSTLSVRSLGSDCGDVASACRWCITL